MQEIIKTLSDIEEKSSRILEAANNEKAALESSFAGRKKEYESKVEAKTVQALDELRTQLKSVSQSELDQQAKDAANTLAQLQESYDENHIQLATQLFNTLISEEMEG